jgi:hypothetical protein
MKSYGFNLLPQKSRALVRKEDKRDNYSLAIAILPLTAVLIWLALSLINTYIVEVKINSLGSEITSRQEYIYNDLANILVANGEMVTKTDALANVINKDIQPEQLFVLIDKIYSNQDDTFTIKGYSRNDDGTFSVTLSAVSYLRLSEVTRLFASDSSITNVKLVNATYNKETNLINGIISFVFTYQNAGTTSK